MNPVLNAIKERRSIRNYKPDMVPKELIEQVIEAGLYATSGMGRQDVITIAVTNREVRDRLAAANASIMGSTKDPFYGAPVVLIVLAEKQYTTHVYDGSLVMGNMMLAAHTLGLGSCWIHRAKEEFETEEYQKLLHELGVQGDYEGIGHCILGYVDGEVPNAAPRKENRVFYVE